MSLLCLGLLVGAPGCGDDDGGAATFETSLAVLDAGGLPTNSFAPGQPITFELTVRSLSNAPRVLTLPTSQEYELLVLHAGQDSIVWQWSLGKGFLQAITNLTFAPNEVKVFTTTWTQVDNGGNPVSAGDFDAQGYLHVGVETQKTSNRDFRPSELRSLRATFTIQ